MISTHHMLASSPGFQMLDWGVLVVYGAAMLAIGVYFSRRTRSREDYLLGGRRMKSLWVGISLFASLISSLSYLSLPSEIIGHGPAFLFYVVALPLVFLTVGYVLIPFIMRLPVTTAY